MPCNVRPARLQLTIVMVALSFALVLNTAFADLRSDLKDFLLLVPRHRIGNIAAYHYVVDQKFRRTAEYTRSSKFKNVWQTLRDSREVTELLEFAFSEIAEPGSINVRTAFSGMATELRRHHMPTTLSMADMMRIRSRSRGRFLRDVIRVMPRKRVKAWLDRKVAENGDFSKVYRVVRSKEFRDRQTKALESPNLAAPLKELSTNGVNVDEYLDVIYTMLSWGPPINRK